MSKNDPMVYNFNLLKERIVDTLKLTKINKELKKIKESTICIGSGGSKVVADYSSIVLNTKNNCTTKVMDPRDVLYENSKSYNNIFVCSYSGNNHGVDILSSLNIKKYLLTYGDVKKENYKTLKCNSSLPKEMSFISLAATMMPMSILLSYYHKNSEELINELFNKISKQTFKNINTNLPFDVISGNDTSTPAIYLDSTFTESGIQSITLHTKYDYCHGRSTLAYTKERNLIYLVSNRKELDNLLLNNLTTRYKDIIVLESNYNDKVIDNYYLTLQSIYLTKHLAQLKNIDLSIVNYDKDLCKMLYKYKGEM